jgi:hemoglobin
MVARTVIVNPQSAFAFLASTTHPAYTTFVTEQQHDITTQDDIKLLVDSFYEKVNRDPLLAPIFNNLARVNWAEHLPTMYSFWSSLLFNDPTYKGQPWPKHAILPVNLQHFERWLSLFKHTVREHFSGPKAIQAMNVAASIADTFQNRMQLVR